jgi:3-deoxy-D-manno-octulosonate 8-phosphate phosphatase (KDO 8-P phosphatase)
MADNGVFAVRPGGRGFPSVETYRAIKLVLFDVDGVLTDGRIVFDANGVESKFFNVRDGLGVSLLQKAGLQAGILTGRSSPVVAGRAKEMGIPPALVVQGASRKLTAFTRLLDENRLTAGEVAFVGDDLLDLPVIEKAGLACCPADAHPDVMKICHVVAERGGGQGSARAVCEHLLKQRGDGSWEKAVNRYLGRP